MAGESQEPGGIPGSGENEHGHQGSFATGEESVEHHPEREEEEGDFATGDERAKPTHEGSFAEGQEAVEHHPEDPESKGDFAEGQEEEHSHQG
ncbi:MAG: hypothetical protein ACHQ4F_06350 [Candidatus Dormibacteria bacterium]